MAFTADEALTLLRRARTNNRLAHAYLITGPEDAGIREVAAGLTGILVGQESSPMKHPDVHVAEPESKSRRITIDQVRDLERELQMRSLRGGRKVAVIFEADRLMEQAANAFLKTLEEPPSQSHIILVSRLPEQLLETILSRCIEVPIQPGPRRNLSARQRKLAELLREHSSVERPDMAQTFCLVRDFQGILAGVKDEVTAETEGAFKAEVKKYREASGVNADWIDDREAYFKALSEARYRSERTVLVDTIESWWADILRQQHGASHLDLPDFAGVTGEMARRIPTLHVLRRAAAIGGLRENFGRNVQEQLAIEVAFLDAFSQ